MSERLRDYIDKIHHNYSRGIFTHCYQHYVQNVANEYFWIGDIEGGREWMATHKAILELTHPLRGFRCWSKILKHLIRFGIPENKFHHLNRLQAITAVYGGLRGQAPKDVKWKKYQEKCLKHLASCPSLQTHFMALCRGDEQLATSSITCNS
jgi:hypothetical protein